MKTPKETGYIMPAEWEHHSATQLHWPSNFETWPGERLKRVEQVYVEIIYALHRYEPVLLFMDPTTHYRTIENMLLNAGVNPANIYIYQVPINDIWARDCGPIFIQNKVTNRFAITDWEYNAWGEKYPPFDSDNALPGWFADTFDLLHLKPGIVLEGGSIDTNGKGVILTTESVLLNKNRNSHLNKSEIEGYLSEYLGAEKIIWLKNGLAGDDTDGHIDDLSRFLNRNTILTMITEDPDDINYRALQENHQILSEAKNLDGEPFNIVTLPLPKTKIEGTTVDGSEFVPASYANFYIANGVVLLPLYDERYDQLAVETFKKYFSDRDIVGIPCADLVWGQGSIHCITQQLYGLNL